MQQPRHVRSGTLTLAPISFARHHFSVLSSLPPPSAGTGTAVEFANINTIMSHQYAREVALKDLKRILKLTKCLPKPPPRGG
ncbi:uncharacterized protein N0V89_009914 [Didymosphaeria variabile]|uniref:Uncharacterized protein n=1 Tax=Didymosphaeria variabile TaxID=1932322 RepID=A0A9W9C713_9PLEO|nr:uncharacterized protein N0V89_009914 [Didymosphaeria variabile]KAJ4348537.1 hypothetical protein N0V89_009914 [Didymosphaeria variabile]